MFYWKKLGNVFNPVAIRPRKWMQEYAQCPTPVLLDDKVVRVFIACRPTREESLQYVSYPGFVDLAREDITRIIGISEKPLLELGRPGAFDEFGIMPSSFISNEGKSFVFYSGWTRMASVPYTLAIGVATSNNGAEEFHKLGDGPMLGISRSDPYFVTGPIVRKVTDTWRMWYLTCIRWVTDREKCEPIYRITSAKSVDGIRWKPEERQLVVPHSEHECQDILAPFYWGDRWHAIFAWRDAIGGDGKYRFGYASSIDLENWQRDDARAGLGLSATGWDSQMMCYPQVLDVDGRLLMFYCGNDFGKEGFGIAEMTDFKQ